jgi:peroxiredoxin
MPTVLRTVPFTLAASKLARKNAGILLLFSGMFAAYPALMAQQDAHAPILPVAVRKQAPDFQLVAADGTKVQLADYRGKVVLVNFWATACGGCVLEIPSFIQIVKTYKGAPFTAVGISMDISYEGHKSADEAWTSVRPFMKKYGVNYTIAMGDDETLEAYALKSLPDTFLIDKSGRIAAAYTGGVIDKATVAANIKSLLSER